MRTRNPNYERSLDRILGRVGRGRAGSPGVTMVDPLGNESTANYWNVIGAVITDGDDETAVLTISGSPGTGTPGWYNPVDFGATGDGVTDDTTAINDAIAAINTTGAGVLYFPTGVYLVTGALTTITASCTIMGDGMAAWDQSVGLSVIKCSSQTAVLFTVTGTEGSFQNIALWNTYAGTPSSASRGIQQTPTTGLEKWDFLNVSVRGFYNNIDIGGGVGWAMHNCWIYGPVNYGVRIRNTVIPDGGDWVISDCGIFSANYNAAAGIRIESSGGGKITGTKVNKGTDSPEKRFTYSIDLSAGSGVITSILQVVGCSLENSSSHGFNASSTGTGTWLYIALLGTQIAPYNSTGSAVNLNAAATGDLDHVMLIGCAFATLIGSSTYAVTLTNIVDIHMDVTSVEFGGGVYQASGSTQIRDLSLVGNGSELYIWRPLMAGGSVITDGTGQAVMAWGPV